MIDVWNNIFEIDSPKNDVVSNNLIKAYKIINNPKYNKIIVSISGGADSDVVLDICYRCDKDKKCDYVWFDTGLEYQATKDHLKYLENKYNIEIKVKKAIKPIPTTCKLFGKPFLSKKVSFYINTLQNHNFLWEDEDVDTLLGKYCVWDEKKQDWYGCKGAIMWWCNANRSSQFCIKQNKWLKEFMIENPPTFKVSKKCCVYAKEKVAKNVVLTGNYDLSIFGVRKSEGGIRSTAYKSCFDENLSECDYYRPIFWYNKQDKIDYCMYFDVWHSDCYYESYGLERTGCAGCPYGRNFEFELEVIKKNEPKLFKAVNNIFGDSYEYTRKYREFYKKKEEELKNK